MVRTAFVSSSFAPEDEVVVDVILRLFSELGLACKQGRVIPKIPDDVLQLIDECDLFVCILTPRKLNLVPSAVSFEIGAALHARKDTIILRQSDVPPQQFYSDRLQLPFDRAAVEQSDARELARLRSEIRELLAWYGIQVRADPEIDRRFDLAKKQAHQLGSAVMAYFHESLHVNEIRDGTAKNFPTEADEYAGRLIRHAIEDQELTKRDGIISEEEVKDRAVVKKVIKQKEFVWIIDPLDGTLNFAYGFPFFCVSIGLLRNEKPVVGVIYDPTAQELYCGRAGAPTEAIDLKTGIRRNLSLVSQHKSLSDAIVMTHLSGSHDARAVTISLLDDMMNKCRAVRMLGSGQMAFAALARGQFDIFFNYQTHIWDIVPGYVILKGAGGFAASSIHETEEWSWESRGIVAAASDELGLQFLEFLRSKLRPDFPRYG